MRGSQLTVASRRSCCLAALLGCVLVCLAQLAQAGGQTPGPPGGLLIPEARPGNDTLRFYGTWTATVEANGQSVTLLSIHTAQGFANFVVTPNGNVPAGNGQFFAANGHYRTNAQSPNDSGTYHFVDADTAVCTNSAGQTVTWKRTARPLDANQAAQAVSGYRPPTVRPGTDLTH
jgi:hypothetical protein